MGGGWWEDTEGNHGESQSGLSVKLPDTAEQTTLLAASVRLVAQRETYSWCAKVHVLLGNRLVRKAIAVRRHGGKTTEHSFSSSRTNFNLITTNKMQLCFDNLFLKRSTCFGRFFRAHHQEHITVHIASGIVSHYWCWLVSVDGVQHLVGCKRNQNCTSDPWTHEYWIHNIVVICNLILSVEFILR